MNVKNGENASFLTNPQTGIPRCDQHTYEGSPCCPSKESKRKEMTFPLLPHHLKTNKQGRIGSSSPIDLFRERVHSEILTLGNTVRPREGMDSTLPKGDTKGHKNNKKGGFPRILEIISWWMI